LYLIKNWEKHFEIAQSKRVEGPLNWVPVPTKHDSLAFRRIMALEDGAAIFGAWILILEIAAKCKVRGKLGELSESGPIEYGPGELAMMTGCPPSLFKRALEVLTSPIVGWIIEDNSEKAQSSLGERSESTHLHDSTEHDKREQNRVGRKAPASRGVPRSARPPVDDDWLAELQEKPAYQNLEVRVVFSKMQVWCAAKGKQPTRLRLINWLNREDQPLNGATKISALDEIDRLYESYGNPTPKDEPLH
jgi:hypothetical protein